MRLVSTYPVVHPLAIVQRGGIIYLVCMFADYADVRMLALHRVQQAQARYEPARRVLVLTLIATWHRASLAW